MYFLLHTALQNKYFHINKEQMPVYAVKVVPCISKPTKIYHWTVALLSFTEIYVVLQL